MLPLPTKHFSKSVGKHNISPVVLCDWIEGTVLFDVLREFVSQPDVVDSLVDNAIYEDQSFAQESVRNGWLELRSRTETCQGGLGYAIDGKRATRSGSWRDYPAHSFCLVASLASVYDWWKEPDYQEQGEIFELLTKHSFETQFPMWKVFRTGWSRNSTAPFRDIACAVASELCEDTGDLDTWDTKGAKEMGLDLLCYRPFSDRRRGIPVYMMQCASGSNWDTKLQTPDLNVWKSIIQFKNEPLRAFATPFTLPPAEYNKSIVKVKGLFFERGRILTASSFDTNWVPIDLKERIIRWCEPRVGQLIKRAA